MERRKATRKILSFLIKAGASAGLIAFALLNIDLGEALDLARGLSLAALGLAFTTLLVEVLAGALRWRIVMRALDGALSYGRCVAIFMLGVFFNQTLPSTVGGDAARIWKAHAAGVGLRRATKSVLLDRVFGFFTLLVFVSAGIPWLWHWMDGGRSRWALVAAVAAGILGFVGLIVVGGLKPRRDEGLMHTVITFAQDARRLFLSPRTTARIMALSAAVQAALVLVVYLLARGVNVELSVAEAFIVVPPALLAATMPISIAGWGVREVSMVGTFALVGVPAERAVVVSVLYGLLLIAWGLFGGLVWLAAGRLVARSTEAPRPTVARVEPPVD